MRSPLFLRHCLVAISLACTYLPTAHSEEKVLNLYSARHYQTDESLYTNFEKATGIKIKRIEGNDDELLERLRNEGTRSPADVFITVDAARLTKADELGLFTPVQSQILEQRIPSHLRSKDWFSFSVRARVIIFNKLKFKKSDIHDYEDLALPKFKNSVCVRSGSHPYNLSLGAAMIAHVGEAKTEAWAKGLVANFARPPRGADIDQIKAVAAGECGVAIVNSYYYARMLRSTNSADVKAMEAVSLVWPNQQNRGTHINVSGGGILKHAPHPDNALKFLEYLASDSAQVYFADGNNEWPAVESVDANNPALSSMGKFKADKLFVGELAKGTSKAQQIFDRVGWQ